MTGFGMLPGRNMGSILYPRGTFTRVSTALGRPSTTTVGRNFSGFSGPVNMPNIPGLPGTGTPPFGPYSGPRRTGVEPATVATVAAATKPIWEPVVKEGLKNFGNWLLPGNPFGGGDEEEPVEVGSPPAIPPGQTGGIIPQGPGGGLQFPWSDPSTPSALKPFALDDSFLKVQYRSPKGYVTVRDPQGRPYPLLRSIAVKMGLWKPKRKPPISVKDWSAFKRAERVERKLRKIARGVMPRRRSSAGACAPKKVTYTRTAKR